MPSLRTKHGDETQQSGRENRPIFSDSTDSNTGRRQTTNRPRHGKITKKICSCDRPTTRANHESPSISLNPKPPPSATHPQPEPAQRLRLAPPRFQAEVTLRVRWWRHPRLVRAPQPAKRPGRRRRRPPEGRLVRGVPRVRAVLTAKLGAPLPRVQQAAGAAGGVVAEAQPRAAQALGLTAEAAPAKVALGVRRRDGLGQDVLSSSFYPASRWWSGRRKGRGGEGRGRVVKLVELNGTPTQA